MKASALSLLAMSMIVNGSLAEAKTSTAPEKSVAVENMVFNPVDVSVKAGTKIVWNNKDLVPHTVTAVDGSFDSKTIDPGKTWSFTPKKKGRFQYKCSFHPTMLGTLIVD